MADEKNTQFNYLLNAFELASQAAEPAKHGYAEKRRALLAYVRELERRASEPSDTELNALVLRLAVKHGLAGASPKLHAFARDLLGAPDVMVSQAPYRPKNVEVALSMCRDANLEAKLPAPMCWDLALYVKRLEDALGVSEVDGQTFPPSGTAGGNL